MKDSVTCSPYSGNSKTKGKTHTTKIRKDSCSTLLTQIGSPRDQNEKGKVTELCMCTAFFSHFMTLESDWPQPEYYKMPRNEKMPRKTKTWNNWFTLRLCLPLRAQGKATHLTKLNIELSALRAVLLYLSQLPHPKSLDKHICIIFIVESLL